jgi:hypothetical protein
MPRENADGSFTFTSGELAMAGDLDGGEGNGGGDKVGDAGAQGAGDGAGDAKGAGGAADGDKGGADAGAAGKDGSGGDGKGGASGDGADKGGSGGDPGGAAAKGEADKGGDGKEGSGKAGDAGDGAAGDAKEGEAKKDGEGEVKWPDKGLPDDWRERMAAGLPEGDVRNNALEVLKKYASHGDALRALAASEARTADLEGKLKGAVKIPGSDAKPEEVEAYKKAIGAPTKIEEVKLNRGENADPLDKEFEDKVKKVAFDNNLTQSQLDAMVQLDLERAAEAERQFEALREKNIKAAQDEMRIAFGVKQYEGKIAQAEAVWDKVFGAYMPREKAVHLRFGDDGLTLGEQPWFVQALVNLGSSVLDMAPIVDELPAGTDPQARINEITALMHTNIKEYERLQPELDRLIAGQERRKQMKGAA